MLTRDTFPDSCAAMIIGTYARLVTAIPIAIFVATVSTPGAVRTRDIYRESSGDTAITSPECSDAM